MDIIGIVAEYNPFHNGHLYQINKVKELYPNSIVIICLGGYFLERGEISIETKEEKTRLALKYGADAVIELPFVFGSNSADIFADASVKLLNNLRIKRLVFGSELNDIQVLTELAKKQLNKSFDKDLKKYLDEGINYPTALNKALGYKVDTPNDLLGISYIKAILKNKFDIEPISIKRTNDYHDNSLYDDIVSASNIRARLANKEDISRYIPEGNILTINHELLFNLLKYKIISDDNLERYLTVDEGLDNRLKKVINESHTLEELIAKTKSKRYTRNRIMRMFTHILIGLTKEDKEELVEPEYVRLLGFNEKGAALLNVIRKHTTLPIITKYRNIDSKIKEYEMKAASIYSLITNEDVLVFENNNKPIKKED